MSHDMTFTLQPGSAPLLVSMPHIGTNIPTHLRAHYVLRAFQVEDTDWHLARLYNFLGALGASILMPKISRYVIDLNRPPDDAPMYAGASNTELCPTRFFTGEPLYQTGLEPDAMERGRRLQLYWQPYHAALAAEIARLKGLHGYVLLWDAHSIRSQIPWLFEGRLPDMSIGSAGGGSANPAIVDAAAQACKAYPHISKAVNGRFKGGYITRRYGQPQNDVHVVQLEMCQCLYMEEAPPFQYHEAKARVVQPLLKEMVANSLKACDACYQL